MAPLKTSILRTLIYADIFDFPLTLEEIHQFLISSRPVSLAKVEKTLALLLAAKKVGQDGSFYFLSGRKKIVNQRKKRKRWSQEKLLIAQRAAQWLKLIPTIKMVAVTGALAINNPQRNDDIDLLIIAYRNRLWLTRLLTVLLIELVAQRRRPQDKQAKDKICLNMFLEEGHLKAPHSNQDLFTAHEVGQLKSLWSRDNICERFIAQNQWVRHFLANAIKQPVRKTKGRVFNCCCVLFDWVEKLAYWFQLAYMKPRQTIEIVQPHRIHFRLHDHRDGVLAEYKKKCQKLLL